jgi:hypothetical protein
VSKARCRRADRQSMRATGYRGNELVEAAVAGLKAECRANIFVQAAERARRKRRGARTARHGPC